jgi:hypothetical protein
MISIQTVSGIQYQTIYVSECDIINSHLLKYIKKPKHQIFDELSDSQYFYYYEIFVDTQINLLYDGKSINLDDTIDFDKILIITFTYNYFYNNDNYGVMEQLDTSLNYIENQTFDICTNHIKRQPLSIIFVKNKTTELCEYALEQNPWVLRYIPQDIITKEMCKKCINNGVTREFIKKICKIKFS